MSVERVVLLVEEPSMEAALQALLPRMLREVTFEIHPHQGKQDLLGKLPSRLRGYRSWLPSTWRIVVIVDRDNEDCGTLKAKLEAVARDAGLRTRSVAGDSRYAVVTRLAIEELEAWYFGDWEAVRSAYPRVPKTIPSKAEYRDPDAIRGGTCEALERVLKHAGYFKTGLRKIEAARAIANHLDPARNRSRSFRALRDALTELGAA